jgi:hypothetical protein
MFMLLVICGGGGGWIDLAENRDRRRAGLNTVMNISQNPWDFWRIIIFLKQDSAPWN